MFKGLCQPFIYNGCEGNDNRFESASACRKACSSSEKRDPWVLEIQFWQLKYRTPKPGIFGFQKGNFKEGLG
uniref:BPTI/Kunitz inhibitor domain-containing protein n=1 Tax=Meloidogyne incognita TaxID=6306 RepID=A0A914LTL3_MELIC